MPDRTSPPLRAVAHAPVVLSREKHYFGFNVHPVSRDDMLPRRCDARRCPSRASFLLNYAWVRQCDKRPTYEQERACVAHAQQFADDWGLVLAPPRLAHSAPEGEQ